MDATSDALSLRKALAVSPQSRLVVCAGRLVPRQGFKDALWAFDILKYLYDDLYLVIAGEGPDRPRLQQFARDILVIDRVRFVGPCDGRADLLRAADVVWVPGHGMLNGLLEAMEAGRPVVAPRLPAITEIVTDGETGLLFPSGDKVALARQTRRLLDDPSLAARLVEAARRRVAHLHLDWQVLKA